MVLNLPKKIIIYDLEFTAWAHSRDKGWENGEHREVIQIGAIKVDTQKILELDSLSLFVKPKKNPILSDFFINLTGISQFQIEKEGIEYKDALNKFFEWSENLPMYSWGRSDDAVLRENCILDKIDFPFLPELFHDMKNVFKAKGVDTTKYSSNNISEAFGIKSPFSAHNGLNDSRTILLALKELNK